MARKLGQWDDGADNFVHADWVPQAGSPARIASVDRTQDIDFDLIGRIPGTDYGTRYDPTTGATHNTAILGILGVGKTTLAAELTWRTLAAGAKVVVIDITNEYARFFETLFGPAEQVAFEEEVNQSIRARINSKDYEGDSAGNQTLFKRELKSWFDDFFAGDHRLLIVNPSRLNVTKDDGGFPSPGGQAKRLVSLNPAEVTAIIAREILNQVSDEITDELRVCLVLEEAHSLAPEWNSTANDGEKQAATATARALMQGRKFGFGSIVVTQRTATVTKSILNQCNTVFALRVYDQTGTEFLGNFIGSDYARLLANLPDRHAIVFGKASSCHSPLLIELNDSRLLGDWRQEIADSCGENSTD
jgi:DNA helicase HerA-like ATPase